MTIKCLIIDDEPLACNLLEEYIGKVDFLELKAKCSSALEALNYLKKEKIGLIFLDIQMPEMSGLEFLQSLNRKPKVIFTTAYENYAVESYELNAVDYLLKPFSFARFLKAVDKLTADSGYATVAPVNDNADKPAGFIFVNDDGKTVKLNTGEIYYIKGLSDYVTIKTANKNYVVRDNLKRIENLLAGSGFVRVHKSFIIPLDKIETVKGNTIKIKDEYISIGRLYKNQFFNKLNEVKLG